MYKSENFQISLWLVSLMSIILLMIIVGGLTRLTESGLSMVDWRLFMGTIPPLSHGDWLKVFEDYKQYPEYQIKNINMTLSEFKYIFWWEYGHRVLGRLIGIIFIIPFIYFALKKYFSNEELYSYSFLLFLGGAQGIIGWWMVKSGLDVNPYVSPTLFTKKNEVILAIGAAGGNKIPTSITQVAYRFLKQNISLNESLFFPRVYKFDGPTQLESHIGVDRFYINLSPSSFDIEKITYKGAFGRVHAIALDSINNKWIGSADPDWEGSVEEFD